MPRFASLWWGKESKASVGEGGGVIESSTPVSEAGYTERLHTWFLPLVSFSLRGTDRL